MPNIPTPIRAALGLAATAVDEARKLPETLPQAVTTVPLRAVSTAMQVSLKLQQHLAVLSARGDEVLSQLRGRPTEPPSWATFDDSPAHTGAVDPRAGEPARAAFDRIDYDSTGFAEGAPDDDGRDRWDAVGVGGTQPETDLGTADAADLGTADGADLGTADGAAGLGEDGDVTAPPPSDVEAAAPPPTLADAVSQPDLPATQPAPATPAPAKAVKAAKAVKKAAPAKAAPAKAAKKAGPAKAKQAGPKAEPLEVAASKAQPSATPTPSTMAAEILHAHEADSGTE